MQHLRTFFLITFNHCNYFPVSFIHCESNCVFSLSLSLFKITAGLCCHTSKGGLSPSGLTWNCFQSGTDGLWDTYWSWPKSNTPQGHWDHMCVCISVSVYVRLAQCRCLEKPFIMLLITISTYVKIQRFFVGVRVYDLLLTGQQCWPLLAMEADILLKCQA